MVAGFGCYVVLVWPDGVYVAKAVNKGQATATTATTLRQKVSREK